MIYANCEVGVVDCFLKHIVASGVSFCGNVTLSVWMCASPLCFSRYKVLAVGECRHASLLNSGKCWEPPYLARIWLVRPM